jgi:hypothetical protein
MRITKHYSNNLNEDEKDAMFKMYKLSYKLGGQPLWFKKKEELFIRYPCFVTFDDKYLIAYAMYQFRKKYNKISLICHDGTDGGKELFMNLIENLVSKKGWLLEAADKVSWLLRKKIAPIISGYDNIVDALDNKDNPNDTITENSRFDVNDKNSYQYTRTFTDVTNAEPITYTSNETLFGTAPCDYVVGETCERECPIGGGKYKRTKNRKRKLTKNRKYKRLTIRQINKQRK